MTILRKKLLFVLELPASLSEATSFFFKSCQIEPLYADTKLAKPSDRILGFFIEIAMM